MMSVYEYKNVAVPRVFESIYLDCLPNFGWQPEENGAFLASGFSFKGVAAAALKFKRDREIPNKAELSRLERQFEYCVRMIEALERSKESRAQIAAFTVGIIGTGFMAGAVFAYLAGMPPLMVLLAVPAFLGWALPYFCYRGVKERRTNRVAPAIDEQYDTLYEVCEKGHALLMTGGVKG